MPGFKEEDIEKINKSMGLDKSFEDFRLTGHICLEKCYEKWLSEDIKSVKRYKTKTNRETA